MGDLTIVPSNLEGANITQDTARLSIKCSFTRDYLIHVLKSNFVRRQIELHTIGQAVKGINITEIKRLLIPLFLIQEQQKIAEILSTWDTAIEQTRKLIDIKKRLKKALMQQLLIGHLRFSKFGSRSQKSDDQSLLWQMVKLQKIISPVKRKNAKGLDRVLTASGEHGLIDQRLFFKRSVAGQSLKNYYFLKKGEFAYNRSSMKNYPYV